MGLRIRYKNDSDFCFMVSLLLHRLEFKIVSGVASPHNRLVREHRADFVTKELVHIINKLKIGFYYEESFFV